MPQHYTLCLFYKHKFYVKHPQDFFTENETGISVQTDVNDILFILCNDELYQNCAIIL